MSEILNSNPENLGPKEETAERKVFSEEEKSFAFSQVEEILDRFEKIGKEKDPEKWYKPMLKEFLKLSKNPQELHPLVRNFILEFSPAILEAFREEIGKVSPDSQEKIIDIYSAIKNFAEKKFRLELNKKEFHLIQFHLSN